MLYKYIGESFRQCKLADYFTVKRKQSKQWTQKKTHKKICFVVSITKNLLNVSICHSQRFNLCIFSDSTLFQESISGYP